MLALGDTFLAGDEYHLWVIVTPPYNGEVVAVSVTTRRDRSETLVTLQPGEHPFIVRESVIPYTYSRIWKVAEIEAALAAEEIVSKEPASPELLKKAQGGVTESEHTPNEVRGFFTHVMEKN